MTDEGQGGRMEIQLFSQGMWSTCQHPVPDSDEDDYEKWMNDGGYGRAEGFFSFEDSPVQLTVWAWRAGMDRPSGSPRYLVDVEVGSDMSVEMVAAATIVDLMNLLAMWAPALQLGAAAHEASERLQRQASTKVAP